ncbi:MAG: glycan-binding surface protein [Mediterranea sp.]|jgi:CheY-specific phosphatase CheX|nr:glycan-binding surface protein [Mediterranea sp.]
MKKIYTYFLTFAVTIGFLSLASCGEEQDELSTAQMGNSAVTLKAYGPSPALRGGELRFIGDNLNQVTAVELPGAGEITDFVSRTATELRITIPQNTNPGYPVLISSKSEVRATTMLVFEEPISISSITTAKVKAGDLFTVEGDYLNLVRQVVFPDNVVVTDFQSQTRYKIEVVVPKEARSGVMKVTNGADIPIEVYSGDQQADVVAPAVTAVTATVKPGETMTVTGTDLDLVQSVVFSGGITVAVSKPGETSFVVTVPKDTKVDAEGNATATVVAYSGAEIAKTFSLVAPAVTALTPAANAKNGTTLTITGTNLDLVTSVVFAGDVTADGFTATADKLTLTIPMAAQAGAINLNTASGRAVATPELTLVAPVITGITPLSIVAGNKLTLTGTDLDLVTTVIFNTSAGAVEVPVKPASATTFEFEVPSNAVSEDVIKVRTANGTEVASSDVVTVAPALPIITSLSKPVKAGKLMTITGLVLETVTAIDFIYAGNQAEPVTRFLPSEDGTSLELYVPNRNGRAFIRLYQGSPEKYTDSEAVSIGTDPVADPSLVIFDFEDRGGNNVANNSWSGIGTKSEDDGVSGAFYEITADKWTQGGWWWLVSDNWCEVGANMAQVSGISNYVLKMDVRLRNDIPTESWCNLNFIFGSQSVFVDIAPYLLKGNVYSTEGVWTTITIPLTAVQGGLTDPTQVGGDWGLILSHAAESSFVGFCIDNIRYELAQ